MPRWNAHNLEKHYKKRMREDAACLRDVFAGPVESVTETDYKAESMKVLTTAWICFSGEAYDKQSSHGGRYTYYDPARHFVDDRLLTTIVAESTDEILTCYHEDFNRRHRSGTRKEEEMVRYLEHLGNQREGNLLRGFSVERFVPPHDSRSVLAAQLSRVKAIPEKPLPKS